MMESYIEVVDLEIRNQARSEAKVETVVLIHS